MTEQAEVVAIDPIIQAFNEGVEKEMDEDATKMLMLKAGCKFSAVNKRYRELSIEAGLDMSRADRRALVASIVGRHNLTTAEGLDKAIAAVSADVLGMNEKKSYAAIKFWAKQNNVSIFTRPRGSGTRQGFTNRFHDFLVQSTPFPTREQAQAYINEHGSKNAIKRIARHLSEYDMAARIVKKYED